MDAPINKIPNHEDIPEKRITIDVFDKGNQININGTSEHFFHKNPNLDINKKIMIAMANELGYEPSELLNLDWDAIDGWELSNINHKVLSQD